MKNFKSYFNRQTVSYTIAICSAVILFIVLSNISIVGLVWSKIVGILSPFIYAFALAFILNRPVMRLEEKVFTNFKRKKALSILVVYIIFIISIIGLLAAVIPQLGLSISYIIDSTPGYLARAYSLIMRMVNDFHWSAELISQIESLWAKAVTFITEFSIAAIPGLLNFSFSIGGGIIHLLMVLIVSVYMLAGKDKLLFQIKKAVYAYSKQETAERFMELANRAEKIFSDFIVGKLIDSAIIGVLCFIGMIFIYPDYTVLIAVVVGVTNMIPFFGPFIGAIPCIFILLMVSPMSAAVFGLFIIALQQFDGNILDPKILGDSLGISPIWVLLGILVGNGLMGLAGMLIGVPTFAFLYSIVSENISNKLKEKGMYANYDENKIDFSEGKDAI